MLKTFNKVAGAFAKDLITAIPRCYAFIADDVKRDYEKRNLQALSGKFYSKFKAGSLTACFSAATGALGMIGMAALVSPTAPSMYAGVVMGMTAGALATIKLYPATEYISAKALGEDKQIKSEAFPYVRASLQELKANP